MTHDSMILAVLWIICFVNLVWTSSLWKLYPVALQKELKKLVDVLIIEGVLLRRMILI